MLMQPPKVFKDHYKMYSYINTELRTWFDQEFSLQGNIGIMGHSMGGHGALILGLRNPNLYRSISAFSPIVNPVEGAWGQKALTGYLGEKSDLWKDYDSCEILLSRKKAP